ncbi:hypothetical protein [Streptomyces sp. NPDC048473]|uniref:hypothetical protein n=1 Tax=Streptomyces sp. NPDC048473 TaxID=3365556 RepID=UPI0037143E48
MNDRRRPLGTGPRPDNSGLSPTAPRAGLAAERITPDVRATTEPPAPGPDRNRRVLGTGHEHAAGQPSGAAVGP